MDSSVRIRARALAHHYSEEIPALNGVDLDIPHNAFLAIVGQNGSGKTTLVKHFIGLLKPTAGDVWVYGSNTKKVSVGDLARQVGFVFQNPDHQIFCGSTREEIGFGPRNLGLSAAEIVERVEDALSAFDLNPYAEVPPAILGFGLRRKVSLASVYAMRPRLFVLDEPTTGLDHKSAQELMQRITVLHETGHTIVLVSHDMRIVAEYAREMLVMHEGRVLASGTVSQVLSRVENLERTHVRPPQIGLLAGRLADAGMSSDVLTPRAFCQQYLALRSRRR